MPTIPIEDKFITVNQHIKECNAPVIARVDAEILKITNLLILGQAITELPKVSYPQVEIYTRKLTFNTYSTTNISKVITRAYSIQHLTKQNPFTLKYVTKYGSLELFEVIDYNRSSLLPPAPLVVQLELQAKLELDQAVEELFTQFKLLHDYGNTYMNTNLTELKYHRFLHELTFITTLTQTPQLQFDGDYYRYQHSVLRVTRSNKFLKVTVC